MKMDTGAGAGVNLPPFNYSPALSGDMKLLAPILFAAAATVLVAVETAPAPEVSGNTGVPPPGVMQSGPLLGPLTPEEVNYESVAVPEPVWASVLAACAVSLLRRGRHH